MTVTPPSRPAGGVGRSLAAARHVILGATADLRQAGRIVRRRPAFAASVVATIALAMCATTLVVAITTAVLWRPLPFPEDRLVVLWESVREPHGPQAFRVTPATFVAWRDALQPFEAMAAFGYASFTALGAGEPVQLVGVRVTADYFRALGVAPLAGRTFTAADEEPGNERVIILSDGLWRTRFGGRLDVLGSSVRLDGAAYTIVGVVPRASYPARPITPATIVLDPLSQQFWIPIPRTPGWTQERRAHVLGVIARLRPDVSARQAREQLAWLAGGHPDLGDGHGLVLTPLRQEFTRAVRPMLLALLASVATVLLLCSANLASVGLVELGRRGREFAVRDALGASTWRLARQVLVEFLLLASLGTAAGLGATQVVLGSAERLLPNDLPLLTDLVIDWRVVLSCVCLALLVGLAMAAWPVASLRRARGSALRAPAALAGPRAHRVLVVSEIALALMLAFTATLLARSLGNVRAQEPGFATAHVLTFDVNLPPARTRTVEAASAVERALAERLAALPGVRGVAFAYDSPLEANWIDSFSFVGERPDAGGRPDGSAWLRIVSPSYVGTLGTRLVAGRAFTTADTWTRPGVALVNEAFVETYLRDGAPLGARLATASGRMTWGPAVPAEFEIVGIVGNERFRGLDQPTPPALYLSTLQFPQGSSAVILRASDDVRALAPLATAAVREVDAEAAVSRVASMDDAIREQLGGRRLAATVVGAFGLAAVALAALGLFGVLSMIVSSRSRELAVRVALGAHPAVVARRVLAEALAFTAVGLAAGLAGTVATSRIVSGLLFGVRALEPALLLEVCGALLVVAVAAASLPAWRAAAADPASTLRA